MNKGAIIGLTIVVAIAGFFLLRGSGDSREIGLDGSYSIKEILAMNKNMECEFNKMDETSNVSGTVIISEGRVRGDFDVKAEVESAPQNFQSHFIVRDGITYIWTSLVNMGYKTEIEPKDSIVGTEDKLDYKCESWEEKEGTFSIPRDITFTSI